MKSVQPRPEGERYCQPVNKRIPGEYQQMKRMPWGLFSLSAGLLAGCEQQPPARAPVPPIEAAAPAKTQTATFALG
jgi:hypothetical protein